MSPVLRLLGNEVRKPLNGFVQLFLQVSVSLTTLDFEARNVDSLRNQLRKILFLLNNLINLLLDGINFHRGFHIFNFLDYILRNRFQNRQIGIPSLQIISERVNSVFNALLNILVHDPQPLILIGVFSGPVSRLRVDWFNDWFNRRFDESL